MPGRFEKFSVYFFLDALQKSSAIFLIPVYTAYMGLEQYGILSICMSVCSVAPIIFYANIYEAAYFSILKNEEGSHAKIKQIILWEAMVSLIVVVIVLILHVFMPAGQKILGVKWFPYLFYTLIMSALSVFPLTVNQALLASEQIRKYTIFSFVCFFCSVSLILVLLVKYDMGAMSFVVGNLMVYLIVALVVVVAVVRSGVNRFAWGEIAPMLRFSSPLVPHNLAHWLRSWADRLLLSWFVSPASTGLFHIAVTYASILNLGIDAFRNINNPRFFSLIDEPEAQPRLTAIMSVSLGGFSLLALGMSLCSREVLSILTNKSYYDAYRYVPFVLTANLIFLIYLNTVVVLFKSSRTGIIAVLTMISAGLSVVVSGILVARLNILGAAISMASSSALMSLLVYCKCQKIHRLPWPIMQASLLSLLPLLALFADSWELLPRIMLLLGACGVVGIMIGKDLKTIGVSS